MHAYCWRRHLVCTPSTWLYYSILCLGNFKKNQSFSSCPPHHSLQSCCLQRPRLPQWPSGQLRLAKRAMNAHNATQYLRSAHLPLYTALLYCFVAVTTLHPMPLNLENCTASHCSEFTGAVNLYKKRTFPLCFRLILKARTHCLPLFRSLAPRLVPSRTSVFTTAGQIAQSGRNATRPSCSIQVFKRVGRIILTKQIIGKRGRISIIC